MNTIQVMTLLNNSFEASACVHFRNISPLSKYKVKAQSYIQEHSKFSNMRS